MNKDALVKEWVFWCATAMLFDQDLSEEHHQTHNDPFIVGLCKEGYIARWPGRSYVRMHRNQPKRSGGMWWPSNQGGDRARVRFCWRMAELCEFEMNGGRP